MALFSPHDSRSHRTGGLRLAARHCPRPHRPRGLYARRLSPAQGPVEHIRAAVDGRQGRARHRGDLGSRPCRRRGLRAARRHGPVGGPQRAARRAGPGADRGTVPPQRRSGRALRPQRPGIRAELCQAPQRGDGAPRRAGKQRGRAGERADAIGRWHRADLRDQRRGTVPADQPAPPAARAEQARAHRQCFLGRHVHAANPPRRPADGSWGVRRPDRVCTHQARPGHPERTVGRAIARHRCGRPRDAPRLGGHPRPEGLAATLPQPDKALLRTPQQAADTILWLGAAAEPARSSSGFWHDRRERPTHRVPWTKQTPQDHERLWTECERLSGW